MKNKNTTVLYIRKLRNKWDINPATKIKQDTKRDVKKRRQEDKKIIKDGY